MDQERSGVFTRLLAHFESRIAAMIAALRNPLILTQIYNSPCTATNWNGVKEDWPTKTNRSFRSVQTPIRAAGASEIDLPRLLTRSPAGRIVDVCVVLIADHLQSVAVRLQELGDLYREWLEEDVGVFNGYL